MKALLIIDIQNDYFPGGKAELIGTDIALANAEAMLWRFREKSFPVIHVQHISAAQGVAFFLPNTEGVKIHERLAPQDGEDLVIKNFPNSFHKTNLYDVIKGKHISELVICGMMTHMCVDTTVRAAQGYELPVTLISDACAAKNLNFDGVEVSAEKVHAAYMAALSGTFAKTITASKYAII